MASDADAAPPKRTLRANCHCGAFVFEIEHPEVVSASECNCSICSRKGALWSLVSVDDLRWVKGNLEGLSKYNFGPNVRTQSFCPTCGTALLATSSQPIRGIAKPAVINVRAIQGVEAWDLTRTPIDGKSLIEPQYEQPEFDGPAPEPVEGGVVYTGSCHCGASRIAVATKKLDSSYAGRIVECSCSICHRGGYRWIYPRKENVSLTGRDSLTAYTFGRRTNAKLFCKTCGIHMVNLVTPEPEESGWSEELRARHRDVLTKLMPVNLRVLADWETIQKDTEGILVKTDAGKQVEPFYVNP